MRPRAAPVPAAYLPARWPPLLYLGFAHACLALAFVIAAFRPAEIASPQSLVGGSAIRVAPGPFEIPAGVDQAQDRDPVREHLVNDAVSTQQQFADILVTQLWNDPAALRERCERTTRFDNRDRKGAGSSGRIRPNMGDRELEI